jgi:hypothetical protein
MIEVLAKKDSYWRKMAFNICKDTSTADDLVNDMYLKLYDCKKEINDGYVYRVINSIFIDNKRKTKNIIDLDISNILIQEIDTEIDFEAEKEYKATKKVFCTLKKHEQIIIKYSYEDGLRKFSRDSEISIFTVQKIRNKLKNLAWEERKKSQELEMQSQPLQVQLGLPLVNLATKERIF